MFYFTNVFVSFSYDFIYFNSGLQLYLMFYLTVLLNLHLVLNFHHLKKYDLM